MANKYFDMFAGGGSQNSGACGAVTSVFLFSRAVAFDSVSTDARHSVSTLRGGISFYVLSKKGISKMYATYMWRTLYVYLTFLLKHLIKGAAERNFSTIVLKFCIRKKAS